MPDDHSPSGGPPEDAGTPAGDTPDSAGGAATGPAVLSRKQLLEQAASEKKGSSRTWWYILGTTAVVLIGVVIAIVVTGGKKDTASKAGVTTTTKAAPVGAACPLTGAPAPGGVVPPRPALGVKIGNYPNDRPSSGLNKADVVFEEPVEGGITRLVAVFQCQGASLVGDLRSARQPDAGILSQLSDPLFVHAGGIDPVIALLGQSPLIDKNILNGNGSDIINSPGRVAPYAMFANTTALWALDPSDTTRPAPIFTYSAALPPAAVAGSGTSVHVPFSSTSDVTWQWNAAIGQYLRSYSGTPDKLLDGSQTVATNVVVMTVQTAIGSWVENSEGGHEVLVTSTGSGPLVVMRGGAAITGTWSRTGLTQPATLTATNGTPITLRPGNTWVELVPAGIPVTPVGTPATTTTTP
jgi:hypothetical protein